MFPAKNGDSFLIKCLGEKNTNILVDLSYPHTYRNYVKSKLQELKKGEELLDLVVFTHIDQDHIQGGITFFTDNADSTSPKIVSVKEVWHNSYRHLGIKEEGKVLNQAQREKIQTKSIYIESNQGEGSSKVSAKQGTRLGALLYRHNYQWNSLFEGQAVSFSPIPKIIGNGVKVTVLSPTLEELDLLKKKWYKELKRTFPRIPLTKDEVFDDAVEYLAQYMEPKGVPNNSKKTSNIKDFYKLAESPFVEDPDIINASSITFVLEYEGRRLLFLGDAPPSLIERQLKKIYPEEEQSLYFDLVKVSHHGSENNTNLSLMNYIDSERYLISTNGNSHGHPDLNAIARIVARPAKEGVKRKLFMSYQTPASSFFNDSIKKKEHNYDVFFPQGNDSTLIEL